MATLTIPSGIEQLPYVNTFIRQCIPLAFTGRVQLIELAVEELLVNIFRYAYHKKNGYAEISCQFVKIEDNPYFLVSIKDWGQPFDPFQVPLPDLELSIEERPIGGLGVHLVRTVTDIYKYKRVGDTNVVELFFSFISEEMSSSKMTI